MSIFSGTLGTFSMLSLAACVLLNVSLALVFVFRREANKRADYFLAALLLVFALTSVHHLLIIEGIYQQSPKWLFLPIYFTLSFGTMLFFAVKLRLFPTYKFESTDVKHFILPVAQWAYFLILFFFTDVDYRSGLGRHFYSPFYGGLEMALYISTFYLYLFGAYRYTQFKISSLRKKKEGGRPLFEAFSLRRMLRVLIILFWVNSAYIAIDFAMYELLRLDMHHFRGFTHFGNLSFAAMAGWTGLSAMQLLVRLPYLNTSSFIFSTLKKILKKNKR